MARNTYPTIGTRELAWFTTMMHETFQKVCAGSTTSFMFGCLLPSSTTLNVLDLLELNLTRKVICETDEKGRPLVHSVQGAPKWSFFPFTVDDHPSKALAAMTLPKATLAFGMASEMYTRKLPLDQEGNPIGNLEDAPTLTGWQTTSVSGRGHIHTLIRDELGQSHQPSSVDGRIRVQMLETFMRSMLTSSF